MKAPFVVTLISSLLVLALPVSAQNLSELVAQLDSDQMNQRTEARNEIQQMLTASVAPSADAAAATALEQEALQLLQSGASHPAQVWLIRMLELTGSEAAVPVLASYLKNSDAELRECARRALVANPSSQATSVLAQALIEASEPEARAYIDAFVYRGDARAVKAIVPLLKSKDSATVVQAANALMLLGDESIFPELKAAHASAPEGSRAAIELAMLETGADAAVCRQLIQSGADVGVAAAAFVVLAKQDAEAAAQVLQAALVEESSPLRRTILGTAMTEPALQAILLDGLAERSTEDQSVILAAVAEQQLVQAEPAVIALLSSPDKALREQVIFTLGEIGGSASFEALYTLFLDKSDEAIEQALAKLDQPEIDAELLKTAQQASDLKQRTSAIRLLTLRNADGVTELLNSYLAPSHSDALRSECLKALEAVGSLETCQRMAQLIVSGDPVKRQAQQSLKRLCLNYDDPDRLWELVFVPAMKEASSDAAREDLLVIADAVAGEKLMAFVQAQIANPEAALRPAALKTLQRWPDMEAGELWIELVSVPGASASDIKAAQAGLSRIAKSNQVDGWEKLKLEMILRAIEKAPTPEFKKAMVNCYTKPTGYIQHYLHAAFEPLAGDPDIGAEVQAVLATVPDSKERRTL